MESSRHCDVWENIMVPREQPWLVAESGRERTVFLTAFLPGTSAGQPYLPYNLRVILASEVYNRWRLTFPKSQP